jgi:hypothetical protein
MQQVGNELVVAFQIHVAHIKEHDAVLRLASLPQNLDRLFVPLQQRPQILRHHRKLHHFRQRPVGQFRNDLGWHAVVRRRFNHQRQLCSRFG